MSQIIVVHLFAVAAMIAVLHYPRPDRKIWVIRFVGLLTALAVIGSIVAAFGLHPITFVVSAFILVNFLIHLAQMVVCEECGGVTLAEFVESTDMMTHHRVDCSQLLRQQHAGVIESKQIGHPIRSLPEKFKLEQRSAAHVEFVFRQGVGFWSIVMAVFATLFAVVPAIITLGVLGLIDAHPDEPVDARYLSVLALFWLVVVGFYLAAAVNAFTTTTFRFHQKHLEIETRFAGLANRQKIEKAAVTDISQISLGYIENGRKTPVWALRVKQGRRTTWLLKRTTHEHSAWLGKAISRWTGVPVRLLQRKEGRVRNPDDPAPSSVGTKRPSSVDTKHAAGASQGI